MSELFAYIDESGILQKHNNPNHRYFIISIVLTDNPQFLARIFKRARLKVINKSEKLKNILKNNIEIKGSELDEKQKEKIYLEITKKCNIEFGVIVVDTIDIQDRFKQNSARAFNYLLKLFFMNYKKSKNRFTHYNKVSLIIDERNVATKALFTLKEYLNTELVIGEDLFSDNFEVYYDNSKNRLLIQLSDYIANTTFRSFHGNKILKNDAATNIVILKKFLTCNDFFTFNNKGK